MRDFDKDFLSNPLYWGTDHFGRRRCHVKSKDPKARRFGVVIETDPLIVYELTVPPGGPLTWGSELFNSVDDMIKVWTVD